MKRLSIKACCVSMDEDSSNRTVQLASKSDLLLPFVGIHPEMARTDPATIEKMVREHRRSLSGIGEIGLDPKYANTSEEYDRQKTIFASMLSVAEDCDLPVSIHSRRSLDDIYDIFTSYSIRGALLHWFDGNKRQLARAMDMGFYVSYGPVTVYANDKQALVARTRSDRLLIETDGPVRFARCFGYKTAQITMIPSIVFCISRVLQMSYDQTSDLLESNSRAYLGI